ncbi:MAG TPA: hypothetical protein VNL15_06380 [Dehalococcoidia bacterium]|nr:hypothetical protein [Chloroflexota bacterium]HXG36575.1 hypothetical protein [Dehalococcoidia bacterium]
MMETLSERIRLAEHLARRLPEVTRNEWMRWVQLVRRYGLMPALRYAERLAVDPTLRPAMQRANRLIAQAVREQRTYLEQLSDKERQEVLGFVAWNLQIRTVRGSERVSSERR